MTDASDEKSFVTHRSLLLQLKTDGPKREVAWLEFYNRYAPIIGGFARKMGAKPQEIGDIIQSVMLGFYAASPHFHYDPSRGRFRGYLKTCTWRNMQEQLAERRGPDGRGWSAISDDDAFVEHAWNDIWETEKLHHAVEMVRERYQRRPTQARTFEAFTMYVLLERPPDEVARDLDLAIESVYQARTRVSRQIKDAMEELSDSIG